MCGILAACGREVTPSLEAIDRGLKVLRHRGPDATHTWQSPTREVVLGHTRLSIIDLSTGDQPLANEDDTLHVVVNGEFYGFEQIRKDLIRRGHRFRTGTDSEIILHLYEEHGVECLHQLRGEYAFVLWDERQQTLFAARDRFGIKPLFYSQTKDGLFFASEVKALHASGVNLAWDEEGFLQAFGLAGNLGGRTHFRDVRNIPPANYLVVKSGIVSIHQYWDFDYPEERSIQVRQDHEHAEQFCAVLDEAVRLRMRADVPVGCYLSGGIDSCSVLALMARHAGSPVRAFSLAFEHSAYDESSIAREMAKRAGAEFTTIPVTQTSLAEDFSDAVWHGETFFANAHAVAKFSLSRAVRDAGYKVVLTGEGSDEILAGYPHFRVDLSRHSSEAERAALEQSLATSNAVSRGLLLADGDVPSSPVFLKRLGYVPALIETREAVFQKLRSILPVSFRSSEMHEALLSGLDVAGQMSGRHVVNQSLYLWNKTTLPGYILTILGDRMEMSHSVEGRVPFLDHCVVEFTRTLPVTQKIHGTTEKFVLREAMKPLLTETVYRRQKHPFLAPPALLNPDEPLHQMMQDTLRGPALDKIPFVRRNAVLKLLDCIPTLDDGAKTGLEVPLVGLFSACVLAERFHL
ncbi:MAG: asparagine synthase (glutamine-hydrolyzing) [Bryobacteraceae bacterium]